MELKIKTCPTCDSKNFRRKTGALTHYHRRREIRVPRATYWECGDCGEQVYSLDDMHKITEYARRHFSKAA